MMRIPLSPVGACVAGAVLAYCFLVVAGVA